MEQHTSRQRSERQASRQPMEMVTQGMPVVDATGARVGAVTLVSAGDPNAVTVQRPTPEASGSTGGLDEMITATASGEPDVPAETAARLLRHGYVKIETDRPDIPPALYVEADRIDAVWEGWVRLNVPAAELTPAR